MRLIPALAALPLFLSPLASAHPVLEDRQANVVITTGATNALQPRFEIRQLQATKPNQWTLLLLAFQKWQAQSQDAPFTTSYFGIAKVHGVPLGNYNNVGNCQSCTGPNVWGYCTHANVLFPSWHRAYLAHFEQEFLKVAQSLVSTFPESRRAVMQNAADKLRLPYYDWAAAPPNGGPTFPAIFTQPIISVDGPSGQQNIFNPLFQVNIKTPSNMYYAAFRDYPTTLRWPTTGDKSATSQNGQAAQTMEQNRAMRKSQVYQLLTGCKNYLSFSTSTGGNNGGCSISLESIHDGIHNDVGGPPNTAKGIYGGNMRALPEASFDPVFWFHHAMVDRIFAMWQTINPNIYGASQTIGDGPGKGAVTWTVGPGSVQGPDSALTPFYRDNGRTFWTTNSVRDWAGTFKYTYPEYTNSDGSANAIMGYINKLYGPNGNSPAGSSKREAAPSGPLDNLGNIISNLIPGQSSSTPSSSSSSSSSYQWTANIKTTHFALQNGYNIFIFTGTPVSEDPSKWLSDPSYVGTASILMSARESMRERINNSTGLLTTSVPLNHALDALVGSGKLKDLTPDTITPFLTKNLAWRVQGGDGGSVPAKEIPGLVVAVSSTVLQAEGGEKAPIWEGFQVIPAITKGRIGGLKFEQGWKAASVGQAVGNVTDLVRDLVEDLI